MRPRSGAFPEIEARMEVVRRVEAVHHALPASRVLPARLLAAGAWLSYRAELVWRKIGGGS